MSSDFAADWRDGVACLIGDVAPERLTNVEMQLILDLFTPAYKRLVGLSAAAPTSRFPHLRQVTTGEPQVKTEILIVDDSKLGRECLQTRLAEHYTDVACAWDLESVMAQLKRSSPDVALLNANIKDSDTLLRVALSQKRPVRVIVFGLADDQPANIASYVDAGASGIHLNSESFDHLLRLIKDDAKTDKVACSPAVSAMLMKNAFAFIRKRNPATQLPLLSPREKQILELLEAGLSNQQIASRLSVTVHTVKNHVHKILSKLEVSTRAEAVAYSRAQRFDLA